MYPTALKIAAWWGIVRLAKAMPGPHGAFTEKAVELADVLKTGRTRLQDAVPMTLGQEFDTYALDARRRRNPAPRGRRARL